MAPSSLDGLLPSLPDPFGEYDTGPIRRLRRTVSSQPDESQRSLLKSLASTTLSGLASVGNLIDVPWSMGRDVLAGENPFDQLLSPFSSENRTTGRGLLEKWGVLGANKPGFDWGDVAGVAVDIADPFLLPLSFGSKALGLAGRAAKDAGLMADAERVVAKTLGRASVGPREARMLATPKMLIDAAADPVKALDKFTEAAAKFKKPVSELLDKPVGGLVGWGAPFAEPVTTFGRAGGVAQKVAKDLDVAGDLIRHGKYSPVRLTADLFSRAGFNTRTREGFKASRSLFGRQEEGIAAAKGFSNRLHDLMQSAGLATDSMSDDTIRLLEGVRQPANAAEQAVYGHYRGFVDSLQSQAREYGLKGKELDDVVQYSFRQMTKQQKVGPNRYKVFDVADPSDIARKDPLRNLPGGTADIRILARQAAPLVEANASVADITAAIEDAVRQGIVQGVPDAKGMAKIFKSSDPDVLASGLFGNYPVFDAEARATAFFNKMASAKEVVRTLGMPGVLRQAGSLPVSESITVGKLLKSIGMGFGKGQGEGGTGAYVRLAEELGIQPQQITKGLISDLKKMQVKKSVADDLSGVAQSFGKAPGVVREPLELYDSALNIWKTFQTGPWPAFQTRNLFSGQVQEALRGTFSGKWLKSINDLVRGKEVAAFKEHPLVRKLAVEWGENPATLTDQRASDLMRYLIRQYGTASKYQGEALQRIGQGANVGGRTAEDFGGEFIGGGLGGQAPGVSLGEIARQYLGRAPGTTVNPLKGKIRGVGGAAESTLGPVVAGETGGHWVETLNRVPGFLKETAAGVDPLEAARRVGEAQVQYESRFFTPFEQGLLRAFPFGKFMLGQTKYVGKELATRPAGRMGTFIRATGAARGEDVAPDYVTQTASIPIPPGKSGDQRYISSFGLMHEDPLSFLGGGVRGILQELGSRSTPAIKAPIEWALGRSFFQRGPEGGRELTEMDPTLGRIATNIQQLATGDRTRQDAVKLPLWIEQTVANTPFSRLLTTIRTATDPRKALSDSVPIPGPAAAANLLTGLRVVDVPEAAQEAILREAITKSLRASGVAKVFERTYVPKETLESLPPDQRAEAESAQQLINMLADRAKKRAKGEKLGPIGGTTPAQTMMRNW